MPQLGLTAATLAHATQIAAGIDGLRPMDEPEIDDEPVAYMTFCEQGTSALLALFLTGNHVNEDALMDCLDNAECLKPGSRKIDVDAARREVERWAKAGRVTLAEGILIHISESTIWLSLYGRFISADKHLVTCSIDTRLDLVAVPESPCSTPIAMLVVAAVVLFRKMNG